MPNHVHLVMAGRINAEQSAIYRMRQPGQGMPVAIVKRRESPFDGAPAQALLHVQVLINVSLVIQIGERMMQHRQIKQDGDDDQDKTQSGGPLVLGGEPREPGPRNRLRLGNQIHTIHRAFPDRGDYI